MVRLRLRRGGSKKKPHYRIVATDSRYPRDGRFIEIIGYYSPVTTPKKLHIDAEKALTWLKNGAQPSDTVRSLLKQKGIMEMWHKVRHGATFEEVLPKVEEQPEPETASEEPQAEAPTTAEAAAPVEEATTEATPDTEAPAEEEAASEDTAEADDSTEKES